MKRRGALQSRDPASAAAEVDSHHPLHVVADFVSFATTFFSSSLIHFVAPPFKIKTARTLPASSTTSAFRCAGF